ncbi:MAG: cation-translocating P-type ATPase [Proteobacteria bacterium]|nr:cation-translocating P-type ATPase [Pseudomonadota bacterium]
MRWLGATQNMTLVDGLRLPLLLAPLLVLGLTGTWWGLSPLKPVLDYAPAMLAATALVQFGIGLPVHLRMIGKLARLQVDGDTLLIVGAGAAFVLGLLRYRHMPADAEIDMQVVVWRDAAFGAGLVSVAMLGDIILRQAQRSVLLPLPRAPAGRVVVPPGDLIPADGVVVDGLSEIQDPVGADDIFPIVVRPGARVHLGARNGDGVLTIEVQKAAQTIAARHVVTDDRLQAVLDWMARGTLAIVLVVIVVQFWQWSGPGDPVAAALRMLSLAAPLGLGFVATAPSSEALTMARRLGVEIRDIAVFDRLRRIGGVVIGHRGVLVPDRLRLITVTPVDGVAAADLIRRAAAVAEAGFDPWGKAILDFAVTYRMRLKPATHYQNKIGSGMSARTENQEILIGTREFLEQHGIDCKVLGSAAAKAKEQGRRLRWVGETFPKRQVLGVMLFGAPSVSGAVEAVKNLERLGLETAWLANADDAAHVALAKHLKIGRLLPDGTEIVEEKLRKMRGKSGPLLVVAADEPPQGLTGKDVMLPFGRRLMEQMPGTGIGTIRHDPRIIVDLLRLASRHRQMVLMNAAIAYIAALLFAFAPFWLGRRSDLGSYEVGVVLILALSSLGLRAMPTTANEVDEE